MSPGKKNQDPAAPVIGAGLVAKKGGVGGNNPNLYLRWSPNPSSPGHANWTKKNFIVGQKKERGPGKLGHNFLLSLDFQKWKKKVKCATTVGPFERGGGEGKRRGAGGQGGPCNRGKLETPHPREPVNDQKAEKKGAKNGPHFAKGLNLRGATGGSKFLQTDVGKQKEGKNAGGKTTGEVKTKTSKKKTKQDKEKKGGGGGEGSRGACLPGEKKQFCGSPAGDGPFRGEKRSLGKKEEDGVGKNGGLCVGVFGGRGGVCRGGNQTHIQNWTEPAGECNWLLGGGRVTATMATRLGRKKKTRQMSANTQKGGGRKKVGKKKTAGRHTVPPGAGRARKKKKKKKKKRVRAGIARANLSKRQISKVKGLDC